MTTLYVRDSAEGYREAGANEVLVCAQGVMAQRFRKGSPTLGNPVTMKEFLRLRLATLDHEIFAVLFLDSRLRLIEYVELFRGTIAGAIVHPREVVKEAILRGAEAVILVHNHPSGDARPSQADEFITRRIKDGLAMIDVRVLDHLIVAEGVYSFAEHGLL